MFGVVQVWNTGPRWLSLWALQLAFYVRHRQLFLCDLKSLCFTSETSCFKGWVDCRRGGFLHRREKRHGRQDVGKEEEGYWLQGVEWKEYDGEQKHSQKQSCLEPWSLGWRAWTWISFLYLPHQRREWHDPGIGEKVLILQVSCYINRKHTYKLRHLRERGK